ncbi:MAG: hypothetical protein R3D27_07630 [Hyphomicrobiaceae bacterium]
MNDEDGGNPNRPDLGAELVIPLSAVALTAYYATTILDSPWTAQATAAVVGLVLVACCVIFFVKAGIDLAAGRARLGIMTVLRPLDSLPRKAGLLALTVAALVGMPWLGFTLTSVLFLALAILLLREGRDPFRTILFAVGLSLTWFIVFVLIFKRQFPVAWFDTQLKTIFAPLLALVGLD